MSHHILYQPLFMSFIQDGHVIREGATIADQTSLHDLLEKVAQSFKATLSPEALHSLNGRLERGLEMAQNGAVVSVADPEHLRRFKVRSSDGNQFYVVDLDARTCECPDSQKNHCCKHRIAAFLVEQAQKATLTPVQNTSSPRPTTIIRPTCSVPPPQEGKVRPTCSIPPTRTEFERAEKRAPANPTKEQPEKTPAARTEEKILKELGFDAKPKSVQEKATEPAVQLGNLYRKYLHGSDLGQQALPVTIRDVTKERVCPHPSQTVIEKWCLWVYGLPEGMPNGILFGSRGEEDLIAIFGKVTLETLKGKMVVIYPKPMNVGGQPKVSIRFRRAQ